MGNGWIIAVAATLVAYLLGTLPTAKVVSARQGHDPTVEGSRNPGATNVYRLAGRRAGLVVLVADVGKGIAATLGGAALGGRELALATGAAAVLGHVAPITRRLRGGKGVATAGGMALVMWPVPSLVLIGVFVAAVGVVRIAAVGSLAMAAGLPIAVAVAGAPWAELGVAAAVAILVIARHHENIRRLVRGEEQAAVDPHPDPDRPAGPPS